MAASLTLFPGSTIRWHDRRFVILDYAGLDAIIAREPGKRRLERIPVNEAEPDHSTSAAWAAPDLVSVPEKEWREAVKKFKIVKPLLTMEDAKRTLAAVEKTARALGRHPVTVYRWIENYRRTGRLSVFLRKERADRGTSRLSNRVDKIIDTAIKKIYLTAERPDVTAVIEEVDLQCFKHKIKKKPHPNTVRAHFVPESGYIRWNGLKQAKRLTARVDSKHAGLALTV